MLNLLVHPDRLAQFQFLARPVPSLDAWLLETLHEWSSTYKVLQAQRLQPQASGARSAWDAADILH